jgi:hypothetical protein
MTNQTVYWAALGSYLGVVLVDFLPGTTQNPTPTATYFLERLMVPLLVLAIHFGLRAYRRSREREED